MSNWQAGHIDEIASDKWPHWIPVRHHFAIESFGINVWRGRDDGTVIPEHNEGEDGAPELYYTAEGHAVFTVDGDRVDAPAGTFVWVTEPTCSRSAVAEADGTLVLSIGAASPGEAYTPSGWDSHYLDG